jgi:hypothetical protein
MEPIPLLVIYNMMLAGNNETIRYRFWLDSRKNNVTRISDNNSPCPTTVSCINQLTSISRIGNNSLDWG